MVSLVNLMQACLNLTKSQSFQHYEALDENWNGWRSPIDKCFLSTKSAPAANLIARSSDPPIMTPEFWSSLKYKFLMIIISQCAANTSSLWARQISKVLLQLQQSNCFKATFFMPDGWTLYHEIWSRQSVYLRQPPSLLFILQFVIQMI